VEIIALILLPVAIAMCGYAIFVFVWRSQMISRKRVRHAAGCHHSLEAGRGSWGSAQAAISLLQFPHVGAFTMVPLLAAG
jgi:hypothetical protein